MANLHEDVLRNIFEYLETPLDWIPVSEGKVHVSTNKTVV